MVYEKITAAPSSLAPTLPFGRIQPKLCCQIKRGIAKQGPFLQVTARFLVGGEVGYIVIFFTSYGKNFLVAHTYIL